MPLRPSSRSFTRAAATTVLLCATVAAAAGCAQRADTSPPAPSPLASATTPAATGANEPTDRLPAPEGRVILTITGGEVHNVEDELRLDRAMLDRLETVSYQVDDLEATGRTVEFSGPLVRTLLDLAGAGDATTMHTRALNDYTVDVPVTDADEMPLMLATRMDGQPMSVADYGPTRLVYPTSTYELDIATYGPRAIWQLDRIDLR